MGLRQTELNLPHLSRSPAEHKQNQRHARERFDDSNNILQKVMVHRAQYIYERRNGAGEQTEFFRKSFIEINYSTNSSRLSTCL